MEDISGIIQETQDMISTLEEEKRILVDNNGSEVDIAILDSEIMTLEKKLEDDLNLLSQYCCDHVFVDDLIDINPDESRTIRYCTFCLFTDEK